MTSTSLSEDELIREVRTALSDIKQQLLSDDTIVQQHDRVVEPFLDKNEGENATQTDFDNAVIFYTAEKAYKTIPAKSTVSGGGVTANMAVSQYIEFLESRSATAMEQIGVVHPSAGGGTPFQDRTSGMMRDD